MKLYEIEILRQYKDSRIDFEKTAEEKKGEIERKKSAIALAEKTTIDNLKQIESYKNGIKVQEDKIKISEALYKLEKKTVRKMILEENKRVDGRGIYDIRPLSCGVDIIPRVHGSGLFSRGQTQVLTICTLGTKKDEQEDKGNLSFSNTIATSISKSSYSGSIAVDIAILPCSTLS